MDDTRPYLSVVATARNDDHGGNLLGRMNAFVAGLVDRARLYDLSVELIIVEWNPPEDRPRLYEALSWPEDTGPCTIRVIEVPPEVHARFAHSDRLPLFQMIAKNVGIRRARGRFVLATNVDVLFSDALSRYLARRQLSPGAFYRVDRYDVVPEVASVPTPAERLELCRTGLVRICDRYGILDARLERAPDEEALTTEKTSVQKCDEHEEPGSPVGPKAKLPVRAAARLSAKLWPAYWLPGWWDRSGIPLTERAIPRLLPRRVRTEWFHDHRLRAHRRLRELALQPGELATALTLDWQAALRAPLHTNACGDFTLMAREEWFALRAYAELEMFSFHIDSLLCFAAHYRGLREAALPSSMCIYHIEHSGGWTPEVERDQSLNRRLDGVGVPRLSHDDLMQFVAQMRRQSQPLVLNEEDWGLASDELPETVVGTTRSGRTGAAGLGHPRPEPEESYEHETV